MMEDRPACKKGVAVPIDIMELMRNMKQSKDLTDTGSKIIQKQIDIMNLPNPLVVLGGVGSPYTRKMLSYLRYKRIPHKMIWGDPSKYLDQEVIEKPKPGLLPTFVLPDEDGNLKAVTDSTPLIRRIDKEVSERITIPSDPALAFINYLIEDFADEWGTKYMFHYRWHDQKDANNAGTILPCLLYTSPSPRDRQKSRMPSSA